MFQIGERTLRFAVTAGLLVLLTSTVLASDISFVDASLAELEAAYPTVAYTFTSVSPLPRPTRRVSTIQPPTSPLPHNLGGRIMLF